MSPVLFPRLERMSILLPVRMVRVFPIQRHARAGAVVERRRLLDGVVAEAEGRELRPVCGGDVEVAGLEFGAQEFLL